MIGVSVFKKWYDTDQEKINEKMLVYINIWKTAQYIEDNSNKVNQRNCWKCPIKVMNVNWMVLSKIFKEIRCNCWKCPIKVMNVN